jgi:hypothetical protein
MYMVASFGFGVVGLFAAALGAYVASRGVILTESQADDITVAIAGRNEHFKRAIITQSKTAQRGLQLVALGSTLQIVSLFIPIAEKCILSKTLATSCDSPSTSLCSTPQLV